jgi:hypothetical protein
MLLSPVPRHTTTGTGQALIKGLVSSLLYSSTSKNNNEHPQPAGRNETENNNNKQSSSGNNIEIPIWNVEEHTTTNQQQPTTSNNNNKPEPNNKDGEYLARQACGGITEMFQGKAGPGLFMGKSEPALDLEAYLFRLHRYIEQWALPLHDKGAGTSLRVFSMAMELLSRLQDNGFGICKRTAHRLCLISVLISIKQTEDFVISNKFWSKVGGIPLDELNMLELEFCKLLQWNLHVSATDCAAHREKFIMPAF